MRSKREAWKGSTRKGRLPVDWPRLRKVVLERCGYRCEWIEDKARCYDKATDADHIIAGDDNSLANLQGLCRRHHLKKTGREARALQLEIKKLGRLPEEKQPGIIDGPPCPPPHVGF